MPLDDEAIGSFIGGIVYLAFGVVIVVVVLAIVKWAFVTVFR
jgi:uncharacterized membrane protein